MQDICSILNDDGLLPRKAKVPVASQPIKAKASACGGLDRKFGYHSRLPVLETIQKYEQKNDSKL